MLREASLHLLHQAAYGKYFAERDGMNPDDAIWVRARARRPFGSLRAGCRDSRRGGGASNQSRRNFAKAFGQTASVFPVAQALVEPIREAQQHCQGQGQTVNKIAQVEPF